MALFNNLDHEQFWPLVKQYIMPHQGDFVVGVITFSAVGIIFSLILVYIMGKIGVFNRKPNIFHHIIARFFIPAIILSTIYFSYQLGLIHESYKVLVAEKSAIVDDLYGSTAGLTFPNNKKKKQFFKKIRKTIKKIPLKGETMKLMVRDYFEFKYLEMDPEDTTKNELSFYVVNKFADDIYQASIKGLVEVAGKDTSNIDEIPYSEFTEIITILEDTRIDQIQKAIKGNLAVFVDRKISQRYTLLMSYTLLVWILIMMIPWVDFYFYKKRKKAKTAEVGTENLSPDPVENVPPPTSEPNEEVQEMPEDQ